MEYSFSSGERRRGKRVAKPNGIIFLEEEISEGRKKHPKWRGEARWSRWERGPPRLRCRGGRKDHTKLGYKKEGGNGKRREGMKGEKSGTRPGDDDREAKNKGRNKTKRRKTKRIAEGRLFPGEVRGCIFKPGRMPAFCKKSPVRLNLK